MPSPAVTPSSPPLLAAPVRPTASAPRIAAVVLAAATRESFLVGDGEERAEAAERALSATRVRASHPVLGPLLETIGTQERTLAILRAEREAARTMLSL